MSNAYSTFVTSQNPAVD